MAAPKLPGDLSWPKLLGTCLAAVTAAWFAGHVGFTNTLTGAAIGSIVATVAAAFFTTTIDKGHSVLIRTERGSVVEMQDTNVVLDEETGATSVLPAQPSESASRWSRINWQAVAIATVVTLALTLLAITVYEEAVGRTWGGNDPGTTIGNTIGGPPQPSATPTETASPTPSPSPSESPTPTPSPSESPSPTPTPTATTTATPAPTPSPSPSASESTDPGPTETPLQ
jgi:outer membrane biosynthesis protein TonB